MQLKAYSAILPMIATLAFLPLAGCGTISLFGKYDIPESRYVADADWPRLADIPAAPLPGAYGAGAPNPKRGAEVARELGSYASE